MSHKFGVKLPHSVEEAYRLDKKNGNDYWCKAIERNVLHPCGIREVGQWHNPRGRKAKAYLISGGEVPYDIRCQDVWSRSKSLIGCWWSHDGHP